MTTSSVSLRGRACLAAFLMIVFTALVAELAARVLESPRHPIVVPGAHPVRSPGGTHATDFVDERVTVADVDLLWRNRPSLRGTFPVIPAPAGSVPTWNLALTPDGLRGETHKTPPPEGSYRILCIGDSVTQGFNVEQGKDYPSALAGILSERHPGARIEVLNAGVPEWSWVQGAAWLLRDGFAQKPDLVIAAFGTADQSRDTNVTDSELMWLLEQPAIRAHAQGTRLLRQSALWRLIEGRSTGAPAGSSWHPGSPGCRLQLARGQACKRVAVEEIAASVHQLGQATRTAGADLLLLNLDFAATASVEAVRAVAARDRLSFLDGTGLIRAEGLQDDIRRSRRLGLAQPHVPLSRLAREESSRMTFRVLVERPRHQVRVRGHGPEGSGFAFDQEMYDDGTSGDEKPGDLVFSAVVESRPSIEVLHYQYHAEGQPEFHVHPSAEASNAERLVRFNRDSTAPVEIFGERRWMSDDLHPNAEGHARIATAVAEKIEDVPSFRRVAAGAGDAGNGEQAP